MVKREHYCISTMQNLNVNELLTSQAEGKWIKNESVMLYLSI